MSLGVWGVFLISSKNGGNFFLNIVGTRFSSILPVDNNRASPFTACLRNSYSRSWILCRLCQLQVKVSDEIAKKSKFLFVCTRWLKCTVIYRKFNCIISRNLMFCCPNENCTLTIVTFQSTTRFSSSGRANDVTTFRSFWQNNRQ